MYSGLALEFSLESQRNMWKFFYLKKALAGAEVAKPEIVEQE